MRSETNRVTFKSLAEKDREWIATEVAHLLPLLAKDGGRHRAWAAKLIDGLLWFWTADAINEDGVVQRDAIKHDPEHLPHTKAALKSWKNRRAEKDDTLQHEHASERAELLRVLEAHAKTKEQVLEILSHLNFGVLVTRGEHRVLPKGNWPADWRDRNWRARYTDGDGNVGLELPLKEQRKGPSRAT